MRIFNCYQRIIYKYTTSILELHHWSLLINHKRNFSANTLTQLSTKNIPSRTPLIFHLTSPKFTQRDHNFYSRAYDLSYLYELDQAIHKNKNIPQDILIFWRTEQPTLEKEILRIKEIRLEISRNRSKEHMSTNNQTKEVLYTLVACLFGAFAVGVHPFFFMGLIYGIYYINKNRKAENEYLATLDNIKELKQELSNLESEIGNKLEFYHKAAFNDKKDHSQIM